MSDHELLLAISSMLDTKLKAELQALKAELHEEIQAVKTELRGEIQSVRAELQEVKAELQEVKAEQQTLKEEVYRIKLYQENVIMPRLNTIGICQFGVDEELDCYMRKLESAVQDVRILKVVVAEHSEKLQKLA